jgi:hypothetical protein
MHRDVGGYSIGHDEQTSVFPFRQQRGRAAQPGAVLVERTTTRAVVADVETLLAPDDPVVPSAPDERSRRRRRRLLIPRAKAAV